MLLENMQSYQPAPYTQTISHQSSTTSKNAHDLTYNGFIIKVNYVFKNN